MRAHMPDAHVVWWGNELTDGTGLAWITEQKPLEASWLLGSGVGRKHWGAFTGPLNMPAAHRWSLTMPSSSLVTLNTF